MGRPEVIHEDFRALRDVGPIEVVNELTSTNTELMARGRAGAPHGTAIRARRQTAGRGQRAHAWTSPEGGLYLSVLLRPQVSTAALPGLPVACALGILDALRHAGVRDARLKWPNDVVVGTAKLAGILTELNATPADVFAVCGVGVNMEASRQVGGSARALRPTGLADELSARGLAAPDLDEFAERVRDGILCAVARWCERVGAAPADDVRRAPLAELLDAYNGALAFRGEPVTVYAIDGDEVASGRFTGVDAWGRALVTCADGAVMACNAAEVSIRPR